MTDKQIALLALIGGLALLSVSILSRSPEMITFAHIGVCLLAVGVTASIQLIIDAVRKWRKKIKYLLALCAEKKEIRRNSISMKYMGVDPEEIARLAKKRMDKWKKK